MMCASTCCAFTDAGRVRPESWAGSARRPSMVARDLDGDGRDDILVGEARERNVGAPGEVRGVRPRRAAVGLRTP